jgi:diguanylate cyclase (GGDEF)-like protein
MQDPHQAADPADKSSDRSGSIAGRDAPALRRIFVVGDDPGFADELKTQLSCFGYDISVFNTASAFKHALQQTPDSIVLMDTTFQEDRLGGVKLMDEIQQGRDVAVPVVFLSACDEFGMRLDAARAGGIAYMIKPVNIGSLIDKLDGLTSTRPQVPYRVMIVDDSQALAEYHSAVLGQAGMIVKTVNTPFDVIQALFEFTPDLILIDLYMPGCSGLDLAKVIRQLDAFVSIPIVFLSAEKDIDRQLFAVGLGGDDFLTKPIQPQHLVSSVTSRIRRSLMLRSFMVRDSLTGLLNHTAISDLLDREVAWALRQKTPLAFAMIDIDHFKQVNDNYGHRVGDRVIKSLARLLRQRLGPADLVGRYGGEEFAVVLTGADAAIKVLDAIRVDFSQLPQLAGDKEFTVTFSCGIADIAHFPDTTGLEDAADRALYLAKRSGRNRVVLAEGGPRSPGGHD